MKINNRVEDYKLEKFVTEALETEDGRKRLAEKMVKPIRFALESWLWYPHKLPIAKKK